MWVFGGCGVFFLGIELRKGLTELLKSSKMLVENLVYG